MTNCGRIIIVTRTLTHAHTRTLTHAHTRTLTHAHTRTLTHTLKNNLHEDLIVEVIFLCIVLGLFILKEFLYKFYYIVTIQT